MKRRSIFRLFACVTAYAAMEVCGLKPSIKAEVVEFIPGDYIGEFHWHNMATYEGVKNHLRDFILYGKAYGVYPPKSA